MKPRAAFHEFSTQRAAVDDRFTGTLHDDSRADPPFSDFSHLIEEAGSLSIVSRRTYFDDTRV